MAGSSTRRGAAPHWKRSLLVIAGAAGCASLVACAPVAHLLPGQGASDDPARSGSGTLVSGEQTTDHTTRFLASARPGQAGTIRDLASGRMVDVVVGRRYSAASGRECLPYRTGESWWLACRNDSGQWSSAPLLVSPGVLEASAAAK
ncbi:MAG: hypothetical protein H6982_02795 [Chromatiales bacterium]|nr:hypothetical protein [Chromatiales bacterium]